MKPRLVTIIVLSLLLVSVAPAGLRAEATEQDSPQEDAYLEFRRWINEQTDEVRSGDLFAAYRRYLASQGLDTAEIDQRIEWHPGLRGHRGHLGLRHE